MNDLAPSVQNQLCLLKGNDDIHWTRLLEHQALTPWGKIFFRSNSNVEVLYPEQTIILVPGMIVASTSMLPLAQRLSPVCRVYAADFPGFGRSDKPKKVLSIAELADCLALWMKQLSLTKAVFVANSFGCQVVVEFAIRYADMVDRLVLQGPTVDPAARGFFRQLIRLRVNAGREARPMHVVSVHDYQRAGLRRVLGTIRYTLRDRIEDKLPLVGAETLIVRGSLDPVVPEAWAAQAANLLPKGSLVTIPGGAHSLSYSLPDEFAEVICSFLGLSRQISER